VIIDYLDLERIVPVPPKTYPPLIIDSNTVLAFSVAFQFFQPIRRRYAKIGKIFRCVQDFQFSPSSARDVRRDSSRRLTVKELFRFLIGETPYHFPILTRRVIINKFL